MLKHLAIKNYALIRELELAPSQHLNVITGETGAGKSIMLGAIGLLMGNRADTKVLWDEQDKCVIEGTFDIRPYKLRKFFKEEDLDYDDQTVIRREISAAGKSRAFINDTPVTLEVMRRLGALLMDIHSQHETLQLANQEFQLQLIDAFGDVHGLKDEYAEKWSTFIKARNHFRNLAQQAETLRQEADYTNFQLEELSQAGFSEGEQEQLEAELKITEHAEEIKSRFHAAMQLLSNGEVAVRSALSEVRGNLSAIAAYSPVYEQLLQRIESTRIELDDIASEIEDEESKIDFDPGRLEFVKERLNLLYRLQQKHRAQTVHDLLVLQSQLQEKSNLTSDLDEALASAKRSMEESEASVRGTAAKLSAKRKKSFDPLSRQLIKLLQELGMPDASLSIEWSETELSPDGIDAVEILFSANKGIARKPLAQVASGGEFSRVMFCIKYVMAEKTAMPTLILDEIDNGISGEIAIKMGNMMKAMATEHQLIAITHLPQIAAKGEAHYFVFKDNSAKKTVSNIRSLSSKERIEEIAKMIGGEKPSKVALENAEELLRN